MVTRKGVIKKTSLADFQNIRTNGIIAINVDEAIVCSTLFLPMAQTHLHRHAQRSCHSL